MEAAFWQALAARGVLAWRVDAAAPDAPLPPAAREAGDDEELGWRVPAGTACQDPSLGVYRLRLRRDWVARQAARAWAQVD